MEAALDYQLFELIRFPFDESAKSGRAGEARAPGELLKPYQRLLTFARNIISKQLPNDNANQWLLDLQHGVEAQNPGQTILTSSPLPFLDEQVVQEFLSRIEASDPPYGQEYLRQLAIAVFCAIYVECATQRPLKVVDFNTSKIGASIWVELASYCAWKTYAEIKCSADLEVSTVFRKNEEEVHSVVNSGHQQLRTMMEQYTDLQKQNSLLRARIDESLTDLKTDVEQISEDAAGAKAVFQRVLDQNKENEATLSLSEANIKSHADAIREELRIDSTKKLWRSRASWSTASFWFSAIAITGAFAAPVIAASGNLDAILAGLRDIGDAATKGLPTDATNAQLLTATISRLAIITVPLAIYFWAVKLLVRFNARSMILMDDARQRSTMMDVYFHLIEKNGATQEERALVLNALFRPAPGHGPENVDPPNFTELLSKAAAGGKT